MTSFLNKDRSKEKVNIKNNEVKEIVNKSFGIKSSDRVFITGKTGSGKTTLAKYLLFTSKNLIVIDGKDGLSNVEWRLEDYTKRDLVKIENGEPFRLRLVNNMTDIIEVLNTAYVNGNCIIYIDEVSATIPPQTKPPTIFTDIWTRGRSRKIGGWANTQRPSTIPLVFLSEAEHFFIYRLSLENDRKRMAEIAGKQVLSTQLDTHGFWYYNLNDDTLTKYKRLAI